MREVMADVDGLATGSEGKLCDVGFTPTSDQGLVAEHQLRVNNEIRLRNEEPLALPFIALNRSLKFSASMARNLRFPSLPRAD